MLPPDLCEGERMNGDYSYWRERADGHLRAAEGNAPALAAVLQALAAAKLWNPANSRRCQGRPSTRGNGPPKDLRAENNFVILQSWKKIAHWQLRPAPDQHWHLLPP
jgi:hypothetical protein